MDERQWTMESVLLSIALREVPAMSSLPRITAIYTDGACSGNPGPGGWGTRIEFSDGQVQELGNFEPGTTNNRMEMQAAIAALEYFQTWQASTGQREPVALYTDSQYVIKGITQWIKGWKRKGWKNAQGKPVLNQDLWQRMDSLNPSSVQWKYVRGHAGNPGNERCDAIARSFSHRRSPALSQYQAPDQAPDQAPAPEQSPAQSPDDFQPSAPIGGRLAPQSQPEPIMRRSHQNLMKDRQFWRVKQVILYQRG